LNWNEFFSFINLEPGFGEICLRLACAMLVGLVIGTEREYTHRPAGMRTHILVALGACVVAITGELIFNQYHGMGATPDPARLSAQVISGVGFLGAGTILREGPTVKGLTTAASLWAIACLGIAAGCGYYTVALMGMVFILVTLTILEVIQNKLMRSHHSVAHDYMLETNDISAVLNLVNSHAQSENASIHNLMARQMENGNYEIRFQVKFGGGRAKQRQQHFLENLASMPEIKSIHQNEPVSGHK